MHHRLHAGKWIPIGLGLLIVTLMLATLVTGWQPLHRVVQRLELITYDIRLNYARVPRTRETAHIVIVDVDENSLQQEGRWPWPRDRIGLLVERLSHAGVAVVAFDMLFSEPDRNPATEVLQYLKTTASDNAELNPALQAAARALDRDRQFATQLQDRDVVLGVLFHREAVPSIGELPTPLASLDDAMSRRLSVFNLPRYTGTLPVLHAAAAASGFLITRPDIDGTIRRSPLVVRHDNALYPSLALETARLYQLLDAVSLETAAIGNREVLEAVQLGNQRIPTDALGNVLIPYRGPARTIPTLSATDILQKKTLPTSLENAVVIVGTSAIGLADLRATPLQNIFPGVEIQATILDGILNGGFPTEPAWAQGANFAAMLLVGLVMAFTLPFLGPLMLTAFTLVVAALWLGLNYWLWREQGFVISLALPLLMIVTLAGVNMAYGFLFESRRRSQLKGLFGQYIPPALVEEMSRAPDDYHLEGESREMTVLFADIRNFTTISESLSAADLKAMLNRFFTPMTRIIFDNRGTIDKYVGDMIMAFWGAPLRDEAHAEHALVAAVAMLEQTRQMQDEMQALGYPEINIGIGINTGVMNVGDMGSVYRRAYTVLGDAVNLASRLEGLTKFYGVGLVVGETTRQQAGNFVYRQLDRVRVKGKQAAVAVYEPVCTRDALTDELSQELDAHAAALESFRGQHWEDAAARFATLNRAHPTRKLYQLYLDRIQELRQRALPRDWDGVYDRREK